MFLEEGEVVEEEEEEEEEGRLWRLTLWGNEDAELEGRNKPKNEERSKRMATKKEKLKSMHRR